MYKKSIRRLLFTIFAGLLWLQACGDTNDRPRDDDDDGGGPAPVTCEGLGGSTTGSTGSGSTQSCTRDWSVCSDNNTYNVSCTGTVGDWSCECRLNGPVASSFVSTTFCELNNNSAAMDEANIECGWNLR